MLARRSLRPALLPSGLICLLLLLALLQYRWSGQVSEAERLRMQGNLQIAVEQFRQDFAHELLSVTGALQADPETIKSEDWAGLAQAQTEWLTTAQGAHLVEAVYLLPADESIGPQKLEVTQAKYGPVDTSQELNAVITRVRTPSAGRRPGPPRGSAWAMDGEGSCLIHLLNIPPQRGNRADADPAIEHRAGLQLIVLNKQYLATKLFPELSARHFGGPDGPVYQTQIYEAGAASATVYNSSGNSAGGVADLEEDLVEMRPRPGPTERGPRDRPFGFRDWHREGRGMPPNMVRFFNTPMLVSDGVAPWKISVRHRAGSVAAAVQTLRWRNLTVSFAVLVVLGASMLTVVRNTQRAQRLAELQMDFVAGVSHELRTPLAVISSAAQNLTDGIVESPGQVKQYGSLIRGESRRLSGMMEQILQFAAGQKRTAYKPVQLRPEELIEAALSLSQTTLLEGGFTVERDIPSGLPPARGESGALTQCLQNLISNAAKYSGDSRWIAIRAAIETGFLAITVEDHGIGIDKAELPHVFDAFYRAKSVRSAQIHGTGLGLNLARSFARDAGGDLTVKSVYGQGSRFTLRIPLDLPASPEPARLLDQTA